MRVEFATEGGIAFFPGLSKPIVIDSRDLPDTEADELKRLIDAADFFSQPAAPRTLPKGAADYRQYTITVEDSGRSHSIRLVDPIEDPRLQNLVAFLRSHTARPRTLGQSEEPQPRQRTSRAKKRDER